MSKKNEEVPWISRKIDRHEILAGLDLETATEDEIDARFDEFSFREIEELKKHFPAPTGAELRIVYG